MKMNLARPAPALPLQDRLFQLQLRIARRADEIAPESERDQKKAAATGCRPNAKLSLVTSAQPRRGLDNFQADRACSLETKTW